MKSYDIVCPVCGTVNKNLYLEETKGWMECEYCHQAVLVMPLPDIPKKEIPVYTSHQLAQRFSSSN